MFTLLKRALSSPAASTPKTDNHAANQHAQYLYVLGPQKGLEISQLEVSEYLHRIKANVAVIWPGEGRLFKVVIERDDWLGKDYRWDATLFELEKNEEHDQWSMRYLTFWHQSKDLAVQVLDKELCQWAKRIEGGVKMGSRIVGVETGSY